MSPWAHEHIVDLGLKVCACDAVRGAQASRLRLCVSIAGHKSSLFSHDAITHVLQCVTPRSPPLFHRLLAVLGREVQQHFEFLLLLSWLLWYQRVLASSHPPSLMILAASFADLHVELFGCMLIRCGSSTRNRQEICGCVPQSFVFKRCFTMHFPCSPQPVSNAASYNTTVGAARHRSRCSRCTFGPLSPATLSMQAYASVTSAPDSAGMLVKMLVWTWFKTKMVRPCSTRLDLNQTFHALNHCTHDTLSFTFNSGSCVGL